MGCWNETCGLSNLPIQEGDTAVLVILQQHMSPDFRPSGYTYPADLWGPLFVPIQGRYNGYGCLEDPRFDEPLLKSVLRDARVQYSGADSFFQDLERGELSLTGWSSSERKLIVGQVLYRHDVWHSLLSQALRNQDLVRLYQDSASWVHKVRELYELGQSTNWTTVWSRADVAYHIECQKSESLFLRTLEAYESGPKLDQFRRVLQEVPWQAGSEDEKRVLNAARGMAELIQVNAHMARLRRAWAPTCGKGSQDTDWEAHSSFARLVHAVVNEQVDREVAEDYGDEED